jgi:hypothetical protein
MRRIALAALVLTGCDRQVNPLYCQTHPTDHSTGCPVLDAAPLPDAAYKDARYADAPPNYYRVAGNISGLTAQGLVLQDNGADDLPRTADGVFIFMTPLMNGATYAVTIKTQPTDETCTVKNGTGTIAGADVTNVMVSCAGKGIRCSANGSKTCIAGVEECCSANPPKCQPFAQPCLGVKIVCDDVVDCLGIPNTICCATQDNKNHLTSVSCVQPQMCGGIELCDPTDSMPCSNSGQNCQPLSDPIELANLNYNSCQ